MTCGRADIPSSVSSYYLGSGIFIGKMAFRSKLESSQSLKICIRSPNRIAAQAYYNIKQLCAMTLSRSDLWHFEGFSSIAFSSVLTKLYLPIALKLTQFKLKKKRQSNRLERTYCFVFLEIPHWSADWIQLLAQKYVFTLSETIFIFIWRAACDDVGMPASYI